MIFVFESVAVAFDVGDNTVVQESVKDGGYDHGAMEELGPVGEGLVGVDDGACLLVPADHEPVEEVALLAVDGRVADLIHDYQGRFVVAV